MNFLNNSFPDFTPSFKERAKQFGMAISAIAENCSLEFYEFVAYFLFSNQEGSYLGQYFMQSGSRQGPCCRSSSPFSWGDVCNTSAKSLDEPRQHRKFSIANLYRNGIDMVGSKLWLPLFDSETSFGVNKTSQIRIIDIRWRNGEPLILKILNRLLRYKIIHMSILSHEINKVFSVTNNRMINGSKSVMHNGAGEVNKYSRLSGLLHQVWGYVNCKVDGLFTLNRQTIGISMPILKWLKSHGSTKLSLEVIKNCLLNRYNLYRKFVNDYILLLRGVFANIEASISIYIPSRICKYVIRVLHKINSIGKRKKSQDPQRLSGLDSIYTMECAIVRP
jgi:hypothetical protein